MNKKSSLALLLCTATLVTGCQTTPGETPEACTQKNWNDIGFSDGSQGFAPNTGPISRACKLASVAKDPIQNYMGGWEEGIRSYCVPSTGYESGTQGHPLNAHCPADLQAEFKNGWLNGIRKFCTLDQGFTLGRMYAPYPDYCPLDLRAAFRSEYLKGVSVYQNKNKNERLQEDLKQKIRLLRMEIDEQNQILARYKLNTKLPNYNELVYQHTQYLDHLHKKLDGLQQELDNQK